MGDDPIDVAWAELEAAWDDEAAHRRFLALCQGLDRLPDAGARYRAVRESDPERAEVAERQTDRLLALALQRLQATKTERSPRRGKTVLFLFALGVSGAMIATALLAYLRFF